VLSDVGAAATQAAPASALARERVVSRRELALQWALSCRSGLGNRPSCSVMPAWLWPASLLWLT